MRFPSKNLHWYNSDKINSVCVCVCVCVLEGIHCGGGWASFQPSMEYRAPFNATLYAIHMLPALHFIFDIRTYVHVHVHVHDDSNYPTDR